MSIKIEHPGYKHVTVEFAEPELALDYFSNSYNVFHYDELEDVAADIAKGLYGISAPGEYSPEARCYGAYIDDMPFFKWSDRSGRYEMEFDADIGDVYVTVEEKITVNKAALIEFDVNQSGKCLAADIVDAICAQINRKSDPVIHTQLLNMKLEIRLRSLNDDEVDNWGGNDEHLY